MLKIKIGKWIRKSPGKPDFVGYNYPQISGMERVQKINNYISLSSSTPCGSNLYHPSFLTHHLLFLILSVSHFAFSYLYYLPPHYFKFYVLHWLHPDYYLLPPSTSYPSLFCSPSSYFSSSPLYLLRWTDLGGAALILYSTDPLCHLFVGCYVIHLARVQQPSTSCRRGY